ncbi:hypothetical protein CH72_5190 [Burkholderia ambifaria AMMD]|nr:hypothetical protein CH72_5190 [Burkholderia ambifaria AMMD]
MDDAAHATYPIRPSRNARQAAARAMRARPAAPAQFCVNGFSVVHRKPVQFAGLK